MKVGFLEEAEEEMYEASAFYEDCSVGLGDRFLDDIQACVDRISERPHLGRRTGKQLRVVLARRFPFSVVYAVEKATIVIIAIAHQRRRPGYWKERGARQQEDRERPANPLRGLTGASSWS